MQLTGNAVTGFQADICILAYSVVLKTYGKSPMDSNDLLFNDAPQVRKADHGTGKPVPYGFRHLYVR